MSGEWQEARCSGCERVMGWAHVPRGARVGYFPGACSATCKEVVEGRMGRVPPARCFLPGCSKLAGHFDTPGDEMHAVPPPPSLTGAKEARLREDPK